MTGTHSPIVIIGAARSGTKFLRDVLAAGPDTAAVPYDVNYVWRTGQEAMHHDRLEPVTATPERAASIRARLRRLARAGNGDVLIEKTVSNGLRIPFVDVVLPDARFVHLIRDGRDVAESAMRQWRAPPDWFGLWRKLTAMPLANARYALWFARNLASGTVTAGRSGGKLWGPRYPGILDDVAHLPLAGVCARQWARTVEYARADLDALPRDRVFEIRYEDLTANEAALADLVERLALPARDHVLNFWRRHVRIQDAPLWKLMPAEDRMAIETHAGAALATLGYGPARLGESAQANVMSGL